MRWKIKVKPKKRKETKFLLLPRYCGDCGNAYWWERINIKKGSEYPSCECGGFLWNFKSLAEEKLRDKEY